MSKEVKRYTITAALPYTNGPVHIGHLAGERGSIWNPGVDGLHPRTRLHDRRMATFDLHR
mgnify:CR=1 FL=1